MNILHHKSWHVYNAKNRERVRKDEEAAEAEEEKKNERVQIAERESRMALLRAKAARRYGTATAAANATVIHDNSTLDISHDTLEVTSMKSSSSSSPLSITNDQMEVANSVETSSKSVTKSVYTSNEHINLFKEEEESAKSKVKRKDTDSTMATSNKTVSQNDCFGQLVKGREPWYLHRQHSSSTKSLLENSVDDGRKSRSRRPVIAPSITLEDPMTSIRRHQSRKEQSRKYIASINDEQYSTSVLPQKATSTSDKRSIDELRRERLEREQREQKRVNDLLGHHTPVVKEENVPYHTQYHPELSRDRHVKRHYNNTTYRSSIRRHNNDNEYDDDRDDDRRSRHRHHRSKYGRPY